MAGRNLHAPGVERPRVGDACKSRFQKKRGALMPQRRRPDHLRLVLGEDRRHPRRKAKKPPAGPALPVTPPNWLSEPQATAWRELVGNAPPGRLTRADAPAVELAAVLLAAFRAGALRRASEIAQLRLALADVGASPVARERLTPPAEPEPVDPAERFFS
jgi:hypothetical protein